MSNIDRIFKIPGNIGDDVVLDLKDRKIKGVSDGESVTILRFLELHEGRTDGIGVPPGLWTNYAWAIVGDARGAEHEISTYDLLPAPGREMVLVPRELVRDLPDTPFWEDDVVEVFDGRRGYVSTIDYLEVEKPGSDRPVYKVRFANYAENFHRRSLDLVERGNVWKFYHGEEMEFESAADEARFYHRISQATSVTNTAHGTSTFPWEQAVEILRNGDADMIWHNWAVAVADPGYDVECYVIDDPDVGERCRLEFLEQLDTASAPEY
jgi:hypothetical protein